MVDVVALAVVVVAYAFVFVTGLLLVKFTRRNQECTQLEFELVAGRNLSVFLGISTMTATIVGGGFLNGTAESVATYGLVWTLAPVGILFGLIFGGLIFAKKMRECKYMTMLDPFHKKYGSLMVILIYLIALFGDLLWSASILIALGTSLGIMTGINTNVAIVISALVTIVYSVSGQMFAIVYTDVIQLGFIIIGMSVCTPFILLDERVASISSTKNKWLGSVSKDEIGVWTDLFITMTFGTIPWQSFFQRVLSMQSAFYSQVLSFSGALFAVILVIPAVLIGAAGISADWKQTELGVSPILVNQSYMILPYVIKEFTPRIPCLLGMAAISAAVMSSVDGAFFGSGSMFTYNIYREVIRKNVSERELLIVLRIAVILIGTLSTLVAIYISTVYGLFILASDFVFVIIFPQLICVVMSKQSNTYGALVGFILSLILRLGGGSSDYLDIPPFIHFPFYSKEKGQLFAFRTFSMLVSLFAIISVSWTFKWVFQKNLLSKKWDVLKCFTSASSYSLTSTTSSRNALPLTPSTPVIDGNGNLPDGLILNCVDA
ncbi:high-affinity choline transporter 1 isoform X2 [Octopus sinensis]|nr:high-affinity choline transporter 1 isoform X2 [Octopus sinensis]XP_036365418.1 high-affinity choline transporter 1 isoform X2 [Octopus sinensis]